MREHHLHCLNSQGFHQLHYTDWGDTANPRAVICVHGLTRNCRDFDALATVLQEHVRVIAVSMAGRGKSDWLPNKEDYGYAQYMADTTALIARVTATGTQHIDWVGTSMGGMLGMLLASRPNTPIRRLVLNDVGTVIPKGSIAVDGISLTVAELGPAHFAVQIVPHTWSATTLSDRAVGDAVNLEADVLGKHVARLVELGRTV